MKIISCGATHRGMVRSENEDNVYVCGTYRSDLAGQSAVYRHSGEEEPQTFGVFDGLGGGEFGEKAALIAAEKLAAHDGPGLCGRFAGYVRDVDQAVRAEALALMAYDMGTTIAAVTIERSRAYICNLGDSRIYLFAGNRLEKLSRDHTTEQSMIDSGAMTEEERGTGIHAHELTQYAGMVTEDDIEPEPAVRSFDLMTGDRLLMCSDGITDVMKEAEIAEVLTAQKDDTALAAQAVMKECFARGCRDNVTVIVIDIC